MPSVGPEMPAHLAKRKRSVDDDAEGSGSPPHKVQAATPPSRNPEEVDLDSSSEDDYGPSVPSTKPSVKTSGPSLPVQPAGASLPPSHNPDELNIDDSSDDDYGPSLGPSKPKSPPQKRVLGPSLPPAPLSQMPSHPANDSSDSEDDYGPSLPPAPGSAAESAMLLERRAQQDQEAQDHTAQAAAKPKRDDWMTVPPSDSDWSSRADPTKLKNRKFQSGKGAKAPGDKGSGGISAIWTETPEQKRQRLEDEVLGRKEAAALQSNRGSGKHSGGGAAASRQDEATARRIQEYNDKNRNRSLYEEHKGNTAPKEKEDDPSQRGFDREKDMALGGRLGHAQKKEMLNKAADFGSRFQKGKYL